MREVRDELKRLLAKTDPEPYDGEHYDLYYRSWADALIAEGITVPARTGDS
jgi:hypothetical protein